MNRHLVLAANGVVLFAFGLVITLFVKDYPWIGYPIEVIGAAFAGYGLARWFYGSRHPHVFDATLFDPIKEEPVKVDTKKLPSRFCHDCGQRAIYWKTQRGFIATTGLPKLSHLIACPDWDGQTARDKEYARYAAAVAAGAPAHLTSIFDRHAPEVEGCGNTVVNSTWEPVTGHDHDPGQVTLECIRCLMEMEKMGAMDRKEVDQRIQAILLGKTA